MWTGEQPTSRTQLLWFGHKVVDVVNEVCVACCPSTSKVHFVSWLENHAWVSICSTLTPMDNVCNVYNVCVSVIWVLVWYSQQAYNCFCTTGKSVRQDQLFRRKIASMYGHNPRCIGVSSGAELLQQLNNFSMITVRWYVMTKSVLWPKPSQCWYSSHIVCPWQLLELAVDSAYCIYVPFGQR